MSTPSATVIRVTIANIDAQTLARTLSPFGFSGTISQTLGFGEWGTEPGVTLESATTEVESLLNVIADILTMRGEQCAYVTFNGASPSLLYPSVTADGRRGDYTLTGL